MHEQSQNDVQELSKNERGEGRQAVGHVQVEEVQGFALRCHAGVGLGFRV